MKRKKILIIVAIVVVILGVAAWLLFRKKAATTESTTNKTNGTGSNSSNGTNTTGGNNNSTSQFSAGDTANKLYLLMTESKVDQAAILSTISGLTGDQLRAVIFAFGNRNNQGAFVDAKDLNGWLKYYLTGNNINSLSSIYTNLGLTFNVFNADEISNRLYNIMCSDRTNANQQQIVNILTPLTGTQLKSVIQLFGIRNYPGIFVGDTHLMGWLSKYLTGSYQDAVEKIFKTNGLSF